MTIVAPSRSIIGLSPVCGIEPATFWFVAQHLNHCATAVPKVIIIHDLYLKHNCLNYTKQTNSWKKNVLFWGRPHLGSKGVDVYYVTCLIDVYEALCYLVNTITDRGARGGPVGWGTALQAGRLRVRLEFFIAIILPVALCPWGRLIL